MQRGSLCGPTTAMEQSRTATLTASQYNLLLLFVRWPVHAARQFVICDVLAAGQVAVACLPNLQTSVTQQRLFIVPTLFSLAIGNEDNACYMLLTSSEGCKQMYQQKCRLMHSLVLICDHAHLVSCTLRCAHAAPAKYLLWTHQCHSHSSSRAP